MRNLGSEFSMSADIARIDRTSIGNASLYHMKPDLKITDKQYLLALTIFFFSYAVFEVRLSFA